MMDCELSMFFEELNGRYYAKAKDGSDAVLPILFCPLCGRMIREHE